MAEVIDAPDKALYSAAKQAAGNWRGFESFGWHDRPEDPDSWTIVYTNYRDSGVIDRSNSDVIGEILAEYLDAEDPDIREEHHGHWACGWIDGYSIRVYRDGVITPAFRAWFDIGQRLEDYPIIDEEDYAEKEAEEIDESWEAWAERDFERCLEAEYPDLDFIFPVTFDLRRVFDIYAKRANVYWEPDGNGYIIDVQRTADYMANDDYALDYLVGSYLEFVVKWIDNGGEQAEYFTNEYDAEERVNALRAAGFFEASYCVA